MEFDDIKDMLITDFTITRSQIQASEEWHVRISLTLTLSIVTAAVALTAIGPTKVGVNKPLLFGLVNLIVIAQLAFLLNYHFYYLQLWANYVALIESKIQLLYDGCNIIEFENRFAPLYFYQRKRGSQKPSKVKLLKRIVDLFHRNANRTLVLLIHLPSLAVYGYGTCVFAQQFTCLWEVLASYVAFSLLILLLLGLFLTMKKTSQYAELEKAKKDSVDEFHKWLAGHHQIIESK